MTAACAILSPPPAVNVSRETQRRIDIILAQLAKWQPRINLVAGGTMAAAQQRHIEDSLQLAPLAPDARQWLDLGSGGGFPGLVIAAVQAENPHFHMRLVESNGKKCAFLRETGRLAALPVTVLQGRIEDVVPTLTGPVDVVSARALASLETLLAMAEPLLARGVMGLFPKGQDVEDELIAASTAWNLRADLIQSRTERNAAIVVVRSAQRKLPPS